MEAIIVVNEKAKPHHLVSKSHELIEAKYRLSLQEQRLIALMASKIRPEDQDFHPYRFKIRDFAELLEIDGEGYYSKLKAVTRKLTTRGITIREGNKVIQLAWLSSATYHEREGWVELRFDPALRPYLLQLKKCFTQYKLAEVLQLRSKYAFRLYELAKKAELLGRIRYQVEELREILGVEKGELRKWIDFRRWCLDKAVKEVNEKTDLTVSYEAIKWGRRYAEIVFWVKKKPRGYMVEPALRAVLDKVLALIPKQHRTKKTIRAEVVKALRRHGEEYVERNILYSNEKAEKNYRVFLIRALREDWARDWWEDRQAELVLSRQDQEARAREEEEERQVEDQKRRVEEYLLGLTDLEREALLEEAKADPDLARVVEFAPSVAIRILAEKRLAEIEKSSDQAVTA